jgi:DNA-directed RNA polymerase subunit B
LDKWPLVHSYFSSKKIAQQEIDSFNQFIEQKLDEIVEENKIISPKIE